VPRSEYERLRKELETSRDIGRFYESMAHDQAAQLEAMKARARTPPPPITPPAVEVTRPPDFSREPAAVVSGALFEWDKVAAKECCPTCRKRVWTFFEQHIARLLASD
jgi:hypothetical protein